MGQLVKHVGRKMCQVRFFAVMNASKASSASIVHRLPATGVKPGSPGPRPWSSFLTWLPDQAEG